MKASQRHRLRTTATPGSKASGGGSRAAQHTPTTGERLRYRADELLSRGTLGIILWLAAVTIVVIFVTALVITVLDRRFNDGTDPGFVEAMWQSLLRIIDPGTMGGDAGWGVRIISLLVTIAGIFLASALIGIIATGLDQRIAELRRGRSFVVERGHTVVLGWSPRLFTLIDELTVANENHPGLGIVVLADRDKTEMEDDIRSRVPALRGSKVVCRTGDPSNLVDLGIVNLDEARSVVVLGDDGPAGDADVVKTLLALRARGGCIGSVPVVTEISDERTARALEQGFGTEVLAVRATEVVARVTAQSCRQSGLSAVVQELLDFDGDEIYFHEEPQLVGRTFGEALLAFDASTVIGRRAADGTIDVCPPMDVVFGPGDEIIAIAEDDDTIVFTGIPQVGAVPDVLLRSAAPLEERMLIAGWSPLGSRVLHELDPYVAPGSRVDVVVDAHLVNATDDLVGGLRNFDVQVERTAEDGDAVARLAAANTYTSVIILGYRQSTSASEGDARSLLNLLLFDRGSSARGAPRPRIVVELLDAKDVDLARVSGADDFVVSDALASYMMAQLSENPELAEVFAQLYTAAGTSVFMEPADPYVGNGPVTFAQVVATTAAEGACAIGWRRVVDGEPEVVVNPPHSRQVTFSPGDSIIAVG
jgi:hypothetical protein